MSNRKRPFWKSLLKAAGKMMPRAYSLYQRLKESDALKDLEDLLDQIQDWFDGFL